MTQRLPRTSRRPWIEPTLEELPRLTALTLQSGNPIPGGGCIDPNDPFCPPGGGTVFP